MNYKNSKQDWIKAAKAKLRKTRISELAFLRACQDLANAKTGCFCVGEKRIIDRNIKEGELFLEEKKDSTYYLCLMIYTSNKMCGYWLFNHKVVKKIMAKLGHELPNFKRILDSDNYGKVCAVIANI